jgi:hypothetical protein
METAMNSGSSALIPVRTTPPSLLAVAGLTLGPSEGNLSTATLSRADRWAISSVASGGANLSIFRTADRFFNRGMTDIQTAQSGAWALTPTGTVQRPWVHVEPPVQPTYYTSPRIVVEGAAADQIFNTVQAFYLSPNKTRDRQIAERIIALYRDALEEEERIYPPSLRQFTEFFLTNKDLGYPIITLTPNETLRVRWIRSKDEFVAIEFTGERDAKLVAEIPGLVPPMHFSRQSVADVVEVVRAIGGSFP